MDDHTITIDDGCGKSHTEYDKNYSVVEMNKKCDNSCDEANAKKHVNLFKNKYLFWL